MSLLLSPLCMHAQRTTTLRVIGTSDVHGNYLAYDYLKGKEGRGGLARIATYVRRARNAYGDNHVVLLDNGDILQGQPAAYYYNFVDDTSEHLCASVLNAMRYDAAAPGNHDIEAGHAVYDRWTQACHHPVVCANVIDTRMGHPYWPPYTVFSRGGVRIAVIGMLTPTVPKWLPQELWSGLDFEDMTTCARRYVAEIKRQNLADVIIGVFHSGVGVPDDTGQLIENASLQVARQVPGFDFILCGHDHRPSVNTVTNIEGHDVLVLNPGAGAERVASATITLERSKRKWRVTAVEGNLVNVANEATDAELLHQFEAQHQALLQFTDKPIAHLDATISSRDAFFGDNAFVDLIHRLQLQLTHADISFAAPLSFDASLQAGTLRIRDMFELYRYENRLYTMKLTGREIRDYLEMSYDGWVRTMEQAQDTMIRFRPHPESYEEGWQRLVTPSYNFDSAAGLHYTVDLRGARGYRVTIDSLSDGRPFSEDSTYTVAINSYRANGGGDLLTRGAGIPKTALNQRIVAATERDMRHYLIEALQQQTETLHPTPFHNWHFVPEAWAVQAKAREMPILFP